MDRLLAGEIIGKLEDWKAAFAANGAEALSYLESSTPDLVLTDLVMPEMDGLELVSAIRERWPRLPVILMTAHGSEEIAIQALRKGAASYVPKNSLARDLAETLEYVLAAARTSRDKSRVLDALTQNELNFVLDNDPALIPPLVNYLEGALIDLKITEPGGLMLLGVALHEALTNAIFHGNLGLGSELRETDERRYYELARERRIQEPYRDRRVYVTARLTRYEATFEVRDEGQGFDPSSLLDPTDPANLEKVSGRGLLLIRTFMDRVEHNDVGNRITMVKHRSS
jgi:CheY-like chemotaxis protein/anti-sigma regulatory factor (Ser/Thr protein kinase)